MEEIREKYLQGKLSEAEREAFENGLSSKDREELAFELGVREGVSEQFRSDVKSKLKNFESNRSAKSRNFNPLYLSAAASVCIIASLIFYFDSSDGSLFDQYYEPYTNYEVTSLRGEEDESLRNTAYQAYDAMDYQASIQAFEQLDSMNTADHFFNGISLIEVHKYDAALKELKQVTEAEYTDYQDAGRWYMALIYLKKEQKETAKSFLDTLSKGNSDFAPSAAEILKKL